MAVNRSLVGKQYESTAPYLIGREKIREFAAAIGDFNPVFHDPAAARDLGHPDLVAPPTFVFVPAFKAMLAVMADSDWGMDVSRSVHGEQSFEYRRPIYAGDELVVDSRIEGIHSSGRNEFISLRQDLVTTDGEQVATLRAVIVSRGTAAEDGS